jgi:hypothetical protein
VNDAGAVTADELEHDHMALLDGFLDAALNHGA